MLSYMPDTVKIKLYVTVLFRIKLGMLITNQWSELFCNIPKFWSQVFSPDNWPNCFLDLASAALTVVTGFGGNGGIWEIQNLCQPDIKFNNWYSCSKSLI